VKLTKPRKEKKEKETEIEEEKISSSGTVEFQS
jgi:hypothetical protein